MPERLGEAVLDLAVDDSKLKSDMRRSEGAVRGWAGRVGKIAAGVAIGAGVAAAGAITKGTLSAVRFESQMAEVRTLLSGTFTDTAFSQLGTDLLGLSKDLGIASTELVPALYQAISAGVPTDNVIDFLRISGRAAIGGVTEIETAVDGLTTVVNAFSAEGVGATDAADVMFASVKAGKTTFQELSDSLFQVAPLANSTGVSFREVSAGLATLTAQGTPTRIATTQLRAAIQGLTRPSKELTAIFKAAGYESGEMAVRQIGLAKASDIVSKATGGSVSQLTKLVGSIEGVQGILGITGSNAERFSNNMDNMDESTGAANAAFETIAKTVGFKWNRIQQLLNVQLLKLGQKILPHVHTVLSNLIPLATTFIGRLGIVLGRIRSLVTANLSLIKGLGIAAGIILGAIATFKVFQLAVRGVQLAMVALRAISIISLGPIALLVAAIAGLIATGITLAGKWEELEKAVAQIWSNITEGLTTKWEEFSTWFETTAWPAIEKAWQTFLDWAGPIWAALVTGLQTAWETFSGWFTLTAWPAITTAWQTFLDWAGPIWDGLVSGVQTAWETFSGWFTLTAWPAITTAWQTFLDWAGPIWATLVTGLQTAWNTFSSWFTLTAWPAVQLAWQGFLDWAGPAWATLVTGLQTAWDTFSSWFTLTAWPAVQLAWQGFLDWAGPAWATLVTGLQTAWDTFSTWFTLTAWPAVQLAWQGFLDWAGPAWATLVTGLQTAWDTFSTWFTLTAWPAIEVSWSNFISWSKAKWAILTYDIQNLWVRFSSWFIVTAWPSIQTTSLGFIDWLGKEWDLMTGDLAYLWGAFGTAFKAVVDDPITQSWADLNKEHMRNEWTDTTDFLGMVWKLWAERQFGGGITEKMQPAWQKFTDFMKPAFGVAMVDIAHQFGLWRLIYEGDIAEGGPFRQAWSDFTSWMNIDWGTAKDLLIGTWILWTDKYITNVSFGGNLRLGWSSFIDWSGTQWGTYVNFLTASWEAFGQTYKDVINGIIGLINTFIVKVSAIEIRVPSVNIPLVGVIGGFTVGVPDIPTIPLLAKGTSDFSGGMAIVGEQGPELVNLPRHSNVLSNSLSHSLSSRFGQQKPLVLNIDGNEIGRILMDLLGEREGRQNIRSSVS